MFALCLMLVSKALDQYVSCFAGVLLLFLSNKNIFILLCYLCIIYYA